MRSLPIDVKKMSPQKRIGLIEEIWDSLNNDSLPVTTEQRSELDRRLKVMEGDPVSGIPWEDVLQRIRQKYK